MEPAAKAVNVYSNLLPDSMATVKGEYCLQRLHDSMATLKGEYQLWHSKWKRHTSVDRPKTLLSALDHCATYPYLSLLLQLLATIPGITAQQKPVF